VGQHQNGETANFAVDPNLGWRMRPDHRFTIVEEGKPVVYAADRDGFRIDPARPPARDPRKVVAVGDSFTFGKGVEFRGSYPALLAERLGGWQVANLAQPGYGLDQTWQALVHEAIPRSPDLIVAGIFPEDFERSLTAFRWRERMNKPAFRLDGRDLVRLTAHDAPGSLGRFIENHSHVLALWRRATVNLGYRAGIGPMWDLNAAILDAMAAAAAEARVPIVFVHVPWRTLAPFPPLARHMDESGALFVDPRDAMRAKPPDSLYLEGDQHLNAAGHALIAAEIARFLEGRPEVLGGAAGTSPPGPR
jgi:hypothetical protein